VLTGGFTRPFTSGNTFGINRAALPAWTPRTLFTAGEQGAWYDPSDFSTLFQDSAGTTPVTAVGQPVGKMLDKSGRGNHASQTTATSRPLLQKDAGGRYYLSFDGVDDYLSAPLALSSYPATLAFGAAAATPGTSNAFASLWQDDSNYKAIFHNSTIPAWYIQDRAATDIRSYAGNPDSSPHVIVANLGSASLLIGVDKASTAPTANTNAFGAISTLFLGKLRNAGGFLTCQNYSGVALGRALTTSENSSLTRYLASKSGAILP
jgi:hypothetical protein